MYELMCSFSCSEKTFDGEFGVDNSLEKCSFLFSSHRLFQTIRLDIYLFCILIKDAIYSLS